MSSICFLRTGRGRGFAVAPFAEPQSHERRRYVAERSRASGIAVPATTSAATLDLSNSRFNNSTCPLSSMPSQSGINTATDSQTPKSLPISSRNRSANSFAKQTVK